MQVNIEDVGPCKKKLIFDVPTESIREKLEESYAKLQSSAQVPGFRVGHAPRKLIENRFGKDVTEEVKHSLIGSSYEEALKEHKIKPLGEPDIDEDSIEFDVESGLKFTVICEVTPEFDLPEYKGLELEKLSTEVSEEELNEAIHNLRRRNAVIEPTEEAVAEDDLPVVDCIITCEGNEIHRVEDRQFSMSEDNWLGGLDRDFWKKLVGKKAGESANGEVTLPDTYQKEEYRGKSATVTVTIKDVKRPRLPELDDEFAKDLLFESLDDLNREVTERLQADKEQQARLDLTRQVNEKLLAAVDFELPEDILKRQAERLAARQKMDLMYRGMPADEVEKVAEELTHSSAEQSERDMRIFFVLRKIADLENTEVTDNELEARIAELAHARGQHPAALHETLTREGQLELLRSEMVEDAVVKMLIEQAKVTDLPAGQAGLPQEAGKTSKEEEKA